MHRINILLTLSAVILLTGCQHIPPAEPPPPPPAPPISPPSQPRPSVPRGQGACYFFVPGNLRQHCGLMTQSQCELVNGLWNEGQPCR